VRSTLDELFAELNELKSLVASIQPVNTALAGHKDTVVQKYVLIRRRFDYAAFAVALYASFEKFVENLIIAYVRLEARRVDYAALPKKLTDKHLEGTAELLWRGRRGDRRYVALSELSMVKNLFECLSGSKPYVLNDAVVTAHEANLRAGEVDALFGAVGVEKMCDLVCHADAIVAWYSAAQGLETPPQDGVKRTVIDERLKNIVERRNQVAHRGGNPDDLLGEADMTDAIGFIESLATSIFGLVVGRYLETHHATSVGRFEMELRTGDKPLKGRTVVIVDRPTERLFVGQPVFVVVRSTGARWGRIQSLRVDDTNVEELGADANAPGGVGVELDFKYPRREGAKLVALAADDDVVWGPLNATSTL
jgi:RiboL-PSP-HEPN